MEFLKKNADGFIPLSECGGIFSSRSENDEKIINSNEWVWGALETKAESFSRGELKIYKKQKGEKIEIENHKAFETLGRPNPFLTLSEMMKVFSYHLDIFGEFLAVFDPMANTITPIIPTDIVRIDENEMGYPMRYCYHIRTINGNLKQFTAEAFNIIHIKSVSPFNLTKGVSVFKTYKETALADNKANEWNRKGFDGTRVSGVLSTTQVLGEETAQAIKKAWKKMFSWFKSERDIAVLDGGLQYTEISKSPKDMDFALLGESSRDRILGAHRIPKALIGQAGDFNKANIFGIEYIWEKYSIVPRNQLFCENFTYQFLHRYFRDTSLFFEIVSNIPLDTESQIRQEQADFAMGALTVNELRTLRGREAVEGGDLAVMSSSLQPVAGVGEVPAQQATKEETVVSSKKKIYTLRKSVEEVKKNYLTRYTKNERKIEKETRAFFIAQQKRFFDTQKIKAFEVFQKEEEKLFFLSLFGVLKEIAFAEKIATAEEIGFEVSLYSRDQILEERIKTQTIKLAGQVNKTTLDRIREVILAAAEEGVGEDIVQERIQKVFKVATESRARAIARTEAGKAHSTAHQKVYEDAGIEKKEWLSIHDGKTRPNHADANGQVVGIDDFFTVGTSKMKHPHDMNAPASECVNCRCRVIPVIE